MSSIRGAELVPVAERPEIDRWILSNLQALTADGANANSPQFNAAGCLPGRRRLHRRFVELVHPPQPPPLLAVCATRATATSWPRIKRFITCS